LLAERRAVSDTGNFPDFGALVGWEDGSCNPVETYRTVHFYIAVAFTGGGLSPFPPPYDYVAVLPRYSPGLNRVESSRAP
jgi:hypothetical protein